MDWLEVKFQYGLWVDLGDNYLDIFLIYICLNLYVGLGEYCFLNEYMFLWGWLYMLEIFMKYLKKKRRYSFLFLSSFDGVGFQIIGIVIVFLGNM